MSKELYVQADSQLHGSLLSLQVHGSVRVTSPKNVTSE